MKAHLYQLDDENGPDHRGDYRCRICSLPRWNAAHDVPERDEDDVSDRILGEGVDDGG